jgi:hypothetical protein
MERTVIATPIEFLLLWDKGTLEANQKAEDEGPRLPLRRSRPFITMPAYPLVKFGPKLKTDS